jgi:hypothetical protein
MEGGLATVCRMADPTHLALERRVKRAMLETARRAGISRKALADAKEALARPMFGLLELPSLKTHAAPPRLVASRESPGSLEHTS